MSYRLVSVVRKRGLVLPTLFGTPEAIIKRMDELSEYGVKNWSVALVGAAGLAAEIEQLGSVINRR